MRTHPRVQLFSITSCIDRINCSQRSHQRYMPGTVVHYLNHRKTIETTDLPATALRFIAVLEPVLLIHIRIICQQNNPRTPLATTHLKQLSSSIVVSNEIIFFLLKSAPLNISKVRSYCNFVNRLIRNCLVYQTQRLISQNCILSYILTVRHTIMDVPLISYQDQIRVYLVYNGAESRIKNQGSSSFTHDCIYFFAQYFIFRICSWFRFSNGCFRFIAS